jgi:hypothetical protein
MNCPSRTDEPLEGDGYNQNPNALANDLTTREDLIGRANGRALRRSLEDEGVENINDLMEDTGEGIRSVNRKGSGGGGGGKERGGGEDGKNGHVVRPSIQTSDVSDRRGSGSGGGGENGRVERYLNMPKESLLRFKQVMIKFAKFIGPGFMVCCPSTHCLQLATKNLLMEVHRSLWHILILEITLRTLLLGQRSDFDFCSSYSCQIFLPSSCRVSALSLAPSVG